jgi:hypothetical protein
LTDEQVNIYGLFLHTTAKLKTLRERVREGSDLDAALDFANYVNLVRLDKVLEPHNRKGAFGVDGKLVREMANELLVAVRDQFTSGKFAEKPHTSNLEEINRKLDLIAGHSAQMSARLRAMEERPVIAEPGQLRVIDGGKA